PFARERSTDLSCCSATPPSIMRQHRPVVSDGAQGEEEKEEGTGSRAGLLARSESWKVAQVSNLLYRRFPIGSASDSSGIVRISEGRQAGNTAIRQVGNLRYGLVHGTGSFGESVRSLAFGRFCGMNPALRATVLGLKDAHDWGGNNGLLTGFQIQSASA